MWESCRELFKESKILPFSSQHIYSLYYCLLLITGIILFQIVYIITLIPDERAPTGAPFERAWGKNWRGALSWTWKMRLDYGLQYIGFSRPLSQPMRVTVLSDPLKKVENLWGGHWSYSPSEERWDGSLRSGRQADNNPHNWELYRI